MTHRVQRVQELIRREIGTIIERNFKFSGSLATVHEVSLTPDLKQCFIYVGVIGKGDSPEVVIKKLTDGRGLIQRELYKRVILKNSPQIVFKFDDSVERGVRVLSLIENLPEAAPDEDAAEFDDIDDEADDATDSADDGDDEDEDDGDEDDAPAPKKRRR